MLSFKILKKEIGFTLLEVLLSLTILTLISIPMLSYFIQAYQYTTDSQNKTVAVNIARNIINYMENQNFRAMKAFLKIEKENVDGDISYTILDSSDCGKKLNISLDDSVAPTICTDSTGANCTDLFYKGTISGNLICTSVLNPIINNDTYDESNISIYLTDYHSDKNAVDRLQQDTPDNVFKVIVPSADDIDLQAKLMKVYVIVDWKENREKIILEGVISDEALR